jgi:DNA-binding NarL/FixJ family response regulator
LRAALFHVLPLTRLRKLSQRVFTEVRRAIQQEEVAAFTDLTPQEMQVLASIVEGKTNREIANTLFLSEGTVRNYDSSILSKLGVANRAEAVAYTVQHHFKTIFEDLALTHP